MLSVPLLHCVCLATQNLMFHLALDQARFTEHLSYHRALFKSLGCFFFYSELFGSARGEVSRQSGFDLGERWTWHCSACHIQVWHILTMPGHCGATGNGIFFTWQFLFLLAGKFLWVASGFSRVAKVLVQIFRVDGQQLDAEPWLEGILSSLCFSFPSLVQFRATLRLLWVMLTCNWCYRLKGLLECGRFKDVYLLLGMCPRLGDSPAFSIISVSSEISMFPTLVHSSVHVLGREAFELLSLREPDVCSARSESRGDQGCPSIRPLQNVFWNLLGFLELLGFWCSDSSPKFIEDPGNIIHWSEESGQQGGVGVKITVRG